MYVWFTVFLVNNLPQKKVSYRIDDHNHYDVWLCLCRYYQQRIVRSAVVQGLSRLSSDLIISAFTTPFDLKEFLENGSEYKYLNFKAIATW